jgi:hypothetical protein
MIEQARAEQRSARGKSPPRMQSDRYSGTVMFLQQMLAGGRVPVAELELKARTAGLLGAQQCLTDAKVFKRAKKSLGIRSMRSGYGRDGEWMWEMPTTLNAAFEPAPVPVQAPLPKVIYAEEHSRPEQGGHAGEHDVGHRTDGPMVPAEWTTGIARLDFARAPRDVPAHVWRQFVTDAHTFLSSSENWATRAAAIGWDALSLFGCSPSRPLDRRGTIGLLWNVGGGRLKQLHAHWATIIAPDGSERTYHRRSATNDRIMPWCLR